MSERGVGDAGLVQRKHRALKLARSMLCSAKEWDALLTTQLQFGSPRHATNAPGPLYDVPRPPNVPLLRALWYL